MNNNGKLSLDLLIGLSLFLFTFIYVANFMPGVFADVRHEISLASHAYRLASLLVEDPGYPLDWDDQVNPSNCNGKEFRPGLANFDSGTLYLNLSKAKVEKLFELLSNPSCRDVIRESLGLSLLNHSYKFYISIKNLDGNATGVGDEVPQAGSIMKFERFVYIDNCSVNNINCTPIAGRCVCKLEVLVWT